MILKYLNLEDHARWKKWQTGKHWVSKFVTQLFACVKLVGKNESKICMSDGRINIAPYCDIQKVYKVFENFYHYTGKIKRRTLVKWYFILTRNNM